jgi:hypothetical protein
LNEPKCYDRYRNTDLRGIGTIGPQLGPTWHEV